MSVNCFQTSPTNPPTRHMWVCLGASIPRQGTGDFVVDELARVTTSTDDETTMLAAARDLLRRHPRAKAPTVRPLVLLDRACAIEPGQCGWFEIFSARQIYELPDGTVPLGPEDPAWASTKATFVVKMASGIIRVYVEGRANNDIRDIRGNRTQIRTVERDTMALFPGAAAPRRKSNRPSPLQVPNRLKPTGRG